MMGCRNWRGRTAPQADETGWLIECDRPDGLEYVTCETGTIGWTRDHLKALRLARREDAEALGAMVSHYDRIAEHMWCAP